MSLAPRDVIQPTAQSAQNEMRAAILSLTEDQIRTLPKDKADVLLEIRQLMMKKESSLPPVLK